MLVKAPYQLITIGLLLTALLAKYPLVGGLSFLEKIPPKFECLDLTPMEKMKGPSRDDNEGPKWIKCTNTEICSKKVPKIQYRPVTDHPEYFNNWVEQMDLLCKPQKEIGFLGSCFFIGILSSITIVPKLADKYGRYYPIVSALWIQLFA